MSLEVPLDFSSWEETLKRRCRSLGQDIYLCWTTVFSWVRFFVQFKEPWRGRYRSSCSMACCGGPLEKKGKFEHSCLSHARTPVIESHPINHIPPGYCVLNCLQYIFVWVVQYSVRSHPFVPLVSSITDRCIPLHYISRRSSEMSGTGSNQKRAGAHRIRIILHTVYMFRAYSQKIGISGTIVPLLEDARENLLWEVPMPWTLEVHSFIGGSVCWTMNELATIWFRITNHVNGYGSTSLYRTTGHTCTRNQWKHSRAINMLALLLAGTTTTRCFVISFRSQIQFNTIQYNTHTHTQEFFYIDRLTYW